MHLYTVCKVLKTLPHSKTSTSSMHNQKSTGAVRQVIQVIFQPLLFEVYFGPPLLHQALHFSKAPALTFKKLHFCTLQSPPQCPSPNFLWTSNACWLFVPLPYSSDLPSPLFVDNKKRQLHIFWPVPISTQLFFHAKHQREWGTRYIVCVPMYISWCPPITVVSSFLERSPHCGEKPSTYSLTSSLLDGDDKGGDCKYIGARYLNSQTYNKEK